IDFALEMSDILPSVSLFLGTYLPYPGSELYEVAVKEGFKPPKNTEGWGKYDQADGDFELDWLPWANSGHKKIFYLINNHIKYLDQSRCVGGKGPFIKTLAKRVLYLIARWRLKRRFFAFPAEVWLEQWWTRHLIRKNLYGGGKKLKTDDA
ncbi:MAG TPA: hypothetical protein PLL10_08795, partial [Elusimicrobiales bacterium]|nr:hypothetical protein [Elusimicrobiales bacterium]